VKRRMMRTSGLRTALITAEREAIAASPWRLHATTYSNRPGSLLAQLEAGQTVQVPGYRLHGLVPAPSSPPRQKYLPSWLWARGSTCGPTPPP